MTGHNFSSTYSGHEGINASLGKARNGSKREDGGKHKINKNQSIFDETNNRY
jgi:hypothetical protein